MDKVKETVRRHWNRRAARFDEGPSHGILNEVQARAWRDLMRKIAGVAPLDVLDVGCGTGFLSLLLAESGHRVTGIDIASSMLELARSKAAAKGLTVPFLEADAEELPVPAGSLDLIVERHVLWTLPHPERALDHWRELLRPGGRVVLIEGQWGEQDRQDEYARIRKRLPLYGGRSKDEIAELVRLRGFTPVRVEPLMDADLWTEPPQRPRYLVTAWTG